MSPEETVSVNPYLWKDYVTAKYWRHRALIEPFRTEMIYDYDGDAEYPWFFNDDGHTLTLHDFTLDCLLDRSTRKPIH